MRGRSAWRRMRCAAAAVVVLIASALFVSATTAQTQDTSPPETTITDGPSGSTTSTQATLTFTSSEAGSSFECRIDGNTFAPCSSPQNLSGLSQDTHTFEARATDPSANVDPTPAERTWTVVEPGEPAPLTLADLPRPSLGRSVNVQVISGVVLVGVPASAANAGRAQASQKGIRFVPLREARQIPVRSLLNTRRGVVRLQSARNPSGAIQSGDFGGGLFQALQSRSLAAKGLTDLRLKGSSFAGCKRARSGRAQTSASRRIRRLSANARGRFGTRGRHSSATVRGTKWTITDRCDGTLTKVSRGAVAVRDFRRRKTVLVRAGKSYLARARR